MACKSQLKDFVLQLGVLTREEQERRRTENLIQLDRQDKTTPAPVFKARGPTATAATSADTSSPATAAATSAATTAAATTAAAGRMF